MVRLLQEVRDYRGDGIAARLFYEGKAAESVALIVERTKANAFGRGPAPAGGGRRLCQRPLRIGTAVGAAVTHRLYGRHQVQAEF